MVATLKKAKQAKVETAERRPDSSRKNVFKSKNKNRLLTNVKKLDSPGDKLEKDC